MRNTLSVMVLLCACLIVVGCGGGSVEKGAGTEVGVLTGTVKDTAGNPIPQATVTVDSLSAVTDGEGQYRFPAVSTGAHTVQAAKPSYTDAGAGHTQLTVSKGQTTTANLVLTSTPQPVYLADMSVDTQDITNNDSKPLTLNGTLLNKSLVNRYYGQLHFSGNYVRAYLGKQYRYFESYVGVSEVAEPTNVTVQIQVLADGVDITPAAVPEIRMGHPYFLQCDVTNVDMLEVRLSTSQSLSLSSVGLGNPLVKVAMPGNFHPPVIDKEHAPVYLSSMTVAFDSMMDDDLHHITLNGVDMAHSLVNRYYPELKVPDNYVRVFLGRKYHRFESWVGVNETGPVKPVDVGFMIYADGVDITPANIPLINIGHPYFVTCDVTNVDMLELRLGTSGSLELYSVGWGNPLVRVN